jgi:hypothetical protein
VPEHPAAPPGGAREDGLDVMVAQPQGWPEVIVGSGLGQEA